MRTGGRLALGLAMLVLAVATPLACGEPFVVGSGSGGTGGKDGGTKPDSGNDGGGGGQPPCTTPIASQIYGDCHIMHKCNADDAPVNDIVLTEVYDDGNPCTTDTCDVTGTAQNQLMPGADCAATGPGKLCDAKGGCVQCLKDMDCTPLPRCDEGKCVPMTCMDNSKNFLETDTDCGGKDCKPCADLDDCLENGDCASGVCSGIPSKKCRPPNCGDLVPNGTETDKDCGGADCVAQGAPCMDGLKCRKSTDCVSGVCKSGVCQAPSCTDGVKNDMETAIDCGGTCAPCPP
jgi:hypothetical protein